jgi:hypothetical protein
MTRVSVLCFFLYSISSTVVLSQPDKIYDRIADARRNPESVHHLDVTADGLPLDLTWLCLHKMINLEDADIKTFSLVNVPGELRNLTHLKKLSFVFTDEQRVLPTPICFLSNLEVLTIGRGSFLELPQEFGQLQHLKELNLSKGKLTRVSESFGNLSSLRLADLSDNSISQLPSAMDHLGNLVCLRLERNQLTSLPGGIGQLRSLKELDLEENRIEELPVEFGRLFELRNLNLSEERLLKLPDSFYKLNKLDTLDLSVNELSEISPDIRNFKNLVYLNLSFNDLESIPPELGQLTWLKHLDIYGNSLDSSEVGAIKELLPDCVVHGEVQNSYTKTAWPQSWKHFESDSLGVSFYYPDNYKIDCLSYDTTIHRVDYDLVFSISLSDTGMVEDYYVESTSSITIKVGQMDFYGVAFEEGFEDNEAPDEDSENGYSDEDVNKKSGGWSILGRQGMKEDASFISLGRLKGMEGHNYTGTFGKNAQGEGSGYLGLEEFEAGFAFLKGKYESISITFFSDLPDQESVFHQVISSVNIDQE